MDPARFAPSPGATAPAPRRRDRLRAFFTGTWKGRVVLAALAVVLLEVAGLPLPAGLTAPAWLVTAVFLTWACVRGGRWVLRRLLWRIRSKMLLSYLFIAVVPVVLLFLFFAIAGFLGLTLVASYVVATHIERVGQELRVAARSTLVSSPGPAADGRALLPHVRALRVEHPALSYALFREGTVVAREGAPPATLPAWLKPEGFAGVARDGEDSWLRVAWRVGPDTLVLQVPLDEALFASLRDRTGVRVLSIGGAESVEAEAGGKGVHVKTGEGRSRPIALPPEAEGDFGLNSVALVERTRWDNGEQGLAPLAIRFNPPVMLKRLSPGTLDLGDIFVKILVGVGISFVILYIVPLVLGLLLARSITRSVHDLSRGTVHLRQGDFGHPIPVRSRDQLGDLADSFNTMARSVEDLLREQAEKQRLEEELRIARQIQMSLLPQDSVSVPGLELSAACIPAAEVGGDYYDLLPLGDGRLGVVVADVSGKGTSAALYMAELKGLMLSLSRIHESPYRLLCEANRILAANMDARSFVTMTYAVADPRAGVLRYARAGHNPLLRLGADGAPPQALTPPGLGLGMDRGERFDQVLEERELPLHPGDTYLFFTDGLSEAMNADGDLFGEARLAAVLARAPALDGGAPEALREEVLREVRLFAGGAPQHDDMTMVVLKVV